MTAVSASQSQREQDPLAGAVAMKPPAAAGATGASPGGDPPASTSEGFRNILEIAGLVVAPTTLLTALAFYFGWTLSSTRALYFGIDPSALGFSTQDYLLRSTDALFVPLGALLLAALAALSLHVLVGRSLAQRRRHGRLLAAATGLAVAGAVLLALGVLSVFESPPLALHPVVVSLVPGVGIAALAYGLHVRARIRRLRGALESPDGRRISALMLTLVALLVVLSVFWTASEYAEALGRGRAQALEQQLASRPSAVVFSRERLHLGAPGVPETRLAGDASAYSFRYDGLRLLVRSGGNWFLLPDGWSRDDAVAIMLPDTDAVRLEFGLRR